MHSELEMKKVYLLWIGAEAKNWREKCFSGVLSKNHFKNGRGKKKERIFAIKA